MGTQVYLELDLHSDLLGWIKTFYLLDLESLDIFTQWYENLDYLILDSGLEISKTNLQYQVIDTSNQNFIIIDQFIKTFSRPYDLLEQIEELEQIVNNNCVEENYNSESDTDSELYTQTEAIGDIISAHISGDTDRVIQLLGSSNAANLNDDEIISNIKKKYL